MVVLNGIAGVKEQVGKHLGYSRYVTIDQHRVNLFAEATGDDQWIHFPSEKTKASRFGGPIVHGLLLLSIPSSLLGDIYVFEGFQMGVHLGYSKVRFLAPVLVGSEVRCGSTLLACEEIQGGVQVTLEYALEVRGADKPACVAHSLMRRYV